MDDRRFDQLVKAVASGASRRSVLKGMLGLGGAALVGSAALEPDVDAARRPTPTPKPPSCPGQQTPVGGQCLCQVPKAPGPNKCGPDCCTGLVTDPYPRLPGHSECCDNACCFGTCYGEELCCPTNPRGAQGQLPSLAEFCLATNECCPAPEFCCSVDGCCDTFCYGGPLEDSFCCPDAQACPGGDASDDNCCNVGETCCGGGTNENYCADLSTGGCCEASDCTVEEGACAMACVAGQCEPITCPEGQICCQDECVSSSEYQACPADPNQCCDLETDVCCGEACCARNRCNAGQQCCGQSQFVCGQSCCENVPGAFCCGGNACCMDGKCAGGVTCCTGSDVACGDVCCTTGQCNVRPFCCPANTTACGTDCCINGTKTCNVATGTCECNPGTEACGGGCCPDGQCNDVSGECCVAGTSPCGDACCTIGQCNVRPFCCPANFTACGTDCCINGTETCNVASGVCECLGGAILCDGVCTLAECCANDTTACALLGYDPECVLCVNGDCTDGGTEFLPCSTFDINQGWCNNGFCVGCLFDGEDCNESSQCCSNNCVQGTCELD